MKFIERFRESRRKQQITVDVHTERDRAIDELVDANRRFNRLCHKHRLSWVSSVHTCVTLEGRAKNVAAFTSEWNALRQAGVL